MVRKHLLRLRDWYARFERPISSLSLIGGFVFDAITLHRVDMPWENFWVLIHLIIIGVCIIFIHRKDFQINDERDPGKVHFWLVNILQFFFGGILSTYVVFYFRSGSISSSWPFLLLLCIAFWANEALKKAYMRLSFQIVLFYLAIFAFSIFAVPVLLHGISVKIFIFSGIMSLVCMWIFLIILDLLAYKKVRQNRNIVRISVGSVFLIMNILYFSNLIPPIPLSMKDSGVYHSVSKDANGNYVVGAEKTHWLNFFKLYDDFHASSIDPVYVYSAVFSPPAFDMNIIHHYQYYDDKTENWIDRGKIVLPVNGGRDGGFRTYSMSNGLIPGRWRVNVETENGQVIGVIRFTIVNGTSTTQSEIK